MTDVAQGNAVTYDTFGVMSTANVKISLSETEKLTNQCISYAFSCSLFCLQARHFLPASKFQHSYSCILLIFYRHQ